MSVINPDVHLQTANDAEQIARCLAADLSAQIQLEIHRKDRAVVAFSGGSTPKPLFRQLARCTNIDWSKVVVTLVDERWVDESNELSNAKFLKENLLDHLSIKPTFLPMTVPKLDPFDGLKKLEDQFTKSFGDLDRFCFDLMILGLGTDGHTASFFPDAPNITELLSPENAKLLMLCESESSQVPRSTWTLAMILRSQSLWLHFTGKQKYSVYQDAQKLSDRLNDYPISAVFRYYQQKLRVYYSD